MQTAVPSGEVLDWVQEQVGPVSVLSHYAHSHGYSELWRLDTPDGKRWLKMHRYPHKQACEIHALTRWTPALGLAPTLVSHRQAPNAVLLTEEQGRPAEKIPLDPAARCRLWSEAGDWLRRLHALENDWFGAPGIDGRPSDVAVQDPTALLRRAVEGRIAEGKERGLFESRQLDFIEFGLREWLPALKGETPRAAHRDYTPRNWLADDDGRLTAVIDFEHARWDVRAQDLSRPWEHEFLHHPDLIDAFFEAYGELNESLKAQIRAVRLANIVSNIVWGVLFNDLPYSDRHRKALSRMMSGSGSEP